MNRTIYLILVGLSFVVISPWEPRLSALAAPGRVTAFAGSRTLQLKPLPKPLICPRTSSCRPPGSA
jgi:hypothetical protein